MNKAERIRRTKSIVRHRMAIMRQAGYIPLHFFNLAEEYGRAVRWGRDPEQEVQRLYQIEKRYAANCRHIARHHFPIGLCSCGHCKAEQFYNRSVRRRKRHAFRKRLRQEVL